MLTNPLLCRYHNQAEKSEPVCGSPERAIRPSSRRIHGRVRGMKKIIWIGGIVFTGLVAAGLVVPHFIDLGIFKGSYLPLLEEILHPRIDVGQGRLSLCPTPSILPFNPQISYKPPYPGHTLSASEQLQLRLKFWPLLQGRFEVTEFVLEKPVVNLLKRPDGTFNYADLADKKGALDRARETKKRGYASKSQEAAVMPL